MKTFGEKVIRGRREADPDSRRGVGQLGQRCGHVDEDFGGRGGWGARHGRHQ